MDIFKTIAEAFLCTTNCKINPRTIINIGISRSSHCYKILFEDNDENIFVHYVGENGWHERDGRHTSVTKFEQKILAALVGVTFDVWNHPVVFQQFLLSIDAALTFDDELKSPDIFTENMLELREEILMADEYVRDVEKKLYSIMSCHICRQPKQLNQYGVCAQCYNNGEGWKNLDAKKFIQQARLMQGLPPQTEGDVPKKHTPPGGIEEDEKE